MHAETRKLIRQMCLANPLWGAPRIHGELLKLGIKISQATVAKYMLRRPYSPLYCSLWKSSPRPEAAIQKLSIAKADRRKVHQADVATPPAYGQACCVHKLR
jgi:hypothetical protein